MTGTHQSSTSVAIQIVLCCSLDFAERIERIANELESIGYAVVLPETAKLIMQGSLTMAELLSEKESGRIVERTVRQDTLRSYFNAIGKADAILVLNYTKRGIENYVGGHVLIEMAYAHVLGKRIYLLNQLPDMAYTDVIKSMGPVILEGSLENLTRRLPPVAEAYS